MALSKNKIASALHGVLYRGHAQIQNALELLHAMKSVVEPPVLLNNSPAVLPHKERTLLSDAEVQPDKPWPRSVLLKNEDAPLSAAQPTIPADTQILVGGRLVSVTTDPVPPGAEVQGKMLVNGEEVLVVKKENSNG